MSFFAAAGFTVFILILFAGIYLNLFGLPGTVVIFLDVLLYSIFTGFEQVGWKIILFLLVFAIIAETIDFLGMDEPTPNKRRSTRKSIGAAALGAFTGMLILTPFFGGPGIWVGFFFGGLAGIIDHGNYPAI